MTPRQRWEAVLRREEPDGVPTDFWSTPEVLERLKRELACTTDDDLWRVLQIDRAHNVEGRHIGPELEHRSIWGVAYRQQEYGDGLGNYREAVHHPLGPMVDPEELEDYPWPSAGAYDFSQVRDEIHRLREWPVWAGHYEPFYVYCGMRGQERALMDTAEAPEFLDKALQKIFEFHYEYNRRLFSAVGREGGITYTYVAEDLGTQTGLLMGLNAIERFLIPRMRAMIGLAHEYGIKAFHHDDGACRPVLPRMAEIGVDILNPIQWRCPGMDRVGLKREFGDAFVFHGGVDNQRTLPFGTREDVKNEVRENIRTLGEGGGYILAPCHNIQPNTPIENILAMYEAAAE